MLSAPTPTSRWGLDLFRGWTDSIRSVRPSRGVYPGSSVRVFVDGFKDVRLNRRNAIAIFDYECHGSYILVLDPSFQSTFVVWLSTTIAWASSSSLVLFGHRAGVTSARLISLAANDIPF